jgi:hypothetical protein
VDLTGSGRRGLRLGRVSVLENMDALRPLLHKDLIHVWRWRERGYDVGRSVTTPGRLVGEAEWWGWFWTPGGPLMVSHC